MEVRDEDMTAARRQDQPTSRTNNARNPNWTPQRVKIRLRQPAADVALTGYGTPVTEVRTRTIVGTMRRSAFYMRTFILYRRNMIHMDIPYDNCPIYPVIDGILLRKMR